MVVNPVYKFVPPKINLPVPVLPPSLINVPAPEITLLTVIPPVEVIPKVIPLVLANAPVCKVKTPVDVLLILDALKILIGPYKGYENIDF